MAEQAPRDEKLRALRDELLQLEQGAEQERHAAEAYPVDDSALAPNPPGPGAEKPSSAPPRNPVGWRPFAFGAGAFVLLVLVVAALYAVASARGLVCVRVSRTCVGPTPTVAEAALVLPAASATASPTPRPTITPTVSPMPSPSASPTALAKLPTGTPTATPTAWSPTPTRTSTVTPTEVAPTPTPSVTLTETPAPQQYTALTLFDFTAVYEQPTGLQVAMISSLKKGVTVYLCEGTTNTERIRYLVSLKPCYFGEMIGYITDYTLSQPNPPWPNNRLTPYPTASP